VEYRINVLGNFDRVCVCVCVCQCVSNAITTFLVSFRLIIDYYMMMTTMKCCYFPKLSKVVLPRRVM
jgi:hypothetical protein